MLMLIFISECIKAHEKNRVTKRLYIRKVNHRLAFTLLQIALNYPNETILQTIYIIDYPILVVSRGRLVRLPII